MPKETYFNLEEVKRQKIMDVIIDEFAEHDYNTASVSKICEKAGIAKGSFYQYFDNKKDLYTYLLTYIGEQKMAYLAKYQGSLDMSETFDFLRMTYAMGVEFTYNNPKLYAIGKFFMHMSDERKQTFFGERLAQNDDYLANMFKKGVAAGTIRDDVDPYLLARMLTDLSNGISEFYAFNLNQNEIDTDTFMNIANAMIDVLENGIGKKNKEQL